MVALVALTGGMLAAGWSLYQYLRYHAPTQVDVPLGAGAVMGQHTPGQATAAQSFDLHPKTLAHRTTITIDPIPRVQEERELLQHGVRTSSLSLGLASAGLFFFAPLQYATIPVLIYMGAPSARHAYDMLHEQGRPSRALAETAVLAICLGGGWYLVGSLGFWLYFLGRLNRHNRGAARLPHSVQLRPSSARRLNGDAETVAPTHALQQGDQVLVGTSETVPVDGVIVEGVAWIQPSGCSDVAGCRLLRAGDRVMAADLVIAGQLSVRVQQVT